jgi:hypothetical protein
MIVTRPDQWSPLVEAGSQLPHILQHLRGQTDHVVATKQGDSSCDVGLPVWHHHHRRSAIRPPPQRRRVTGGVLRASVNASEGNYANGPSGLSRYVASELRALRLAVALAEPVNQHSEQHLAASSCGVCTVITHLSNCDQSSLIPDIQASAASTEFCLLAVVQYSCKLAADLLLSTVGGIVAVGPTASSSCNGRGAMLRVRPRTVEEQHFVDFDFDFPLPPSLTRIPHYGKARGKCV